MNWLARFWQGLKSLVSPRLKGPDPRRYLAGAAPGQWASNHLAEAAQCKGWQFVASRTLARMCSQAEIAVHHVGMVYEQERAVRRAMKLARLTRSRRELSRWKEYLHQLKADPTASSSRTARKPVSADDPLLRLLQRVNPEWSGVTFLFAAAQQLALTGSAMIWCVRNQAGIPAELYVLPTGLVSPRLASPEFPQGSYWLTPLSNWGLSPPGGYSPGTLGQALLTGAEIDARDIKPIRWPHPLYLSDGLSPLAAGALWVDVASEIDRASWYAMQNMERPGLIITQADASIDPDPADKVRFREDLAADHAGVANTGKHLWLPKGLAAQPRSSTPLELDHANSRTQYRDMSLALHAVSPISAGITEAGNYSAFWAAIKQTTELSVQPMLDLIAGELSELLGSSYPGPRREATFTARAIDDPQLLEQRLRTDIQAGNVILVDEYRAIRGYKPLGGEEGKAFAGAKAPPAEEEKPEKDKPDADKPTGDDDTGTRQDHRDAPPGRNSKAHTAKAHANGRIHR